MEECLKKKEWLKMKVLAKINIIVKQIRVDENLRVSENVVANWKKWSWPKDSLLENEMGSKRQNTISKFFLRFAEIQNVESEEGVSGLRKYTFLYVISRRLMLNNNYSRNVSRM